MIEKEHLPLRKLALWLVIIATVITGGYIIFLSALSMWVGISHLHEKASWAPILAGAATTFLAFLSSFFLIRFTIRKIKEKDIIRI
ncbi:MAG: hypothetical protein JRJ03_09860 [Deltaproteobacteria bacterium]|nr:hypothetical protein [Deltaproteobacteria bacterium]